MKKIRRFLGIALSVLILIAIPAETAYAFSCIWTTCGCKDRGLPGCSNSMTCWYGDGDGCSGHSWYYYGTTSASCTEEGKEIYKCSICPGERIYTTPALGHDWGSWSCHDSAQHKRTCNRCGLVQYENHTLGNWSFVGDGIYTRKCSVCSYEQRKSLYIELSSTNWTAGYVTVTVKGYDGGAGHSSISLYRVNCITGVTNLVNTYSHSGTGWAIDSYVQTGEGIYYFYAVSTDKGGNAIQVNSNRVYIDHTEPVIYGAESTRSEWTNSAPNISVRATDYLYGTSTVGSGVVSLTIYDDNGNPVRSGGSTVSYTLENRYEGEHTWRIEARDGVGHVTTRYVTTRYDITAPNIEGTETTYVTDTGETISGYCQDNIIDQHIDDEPYRSKNGANSSSGIRSVILYKVTDSGQTAIYSDTTYKVFGSPDPHSSFNVYLDVSDKDDVADHYILIVEDFAGNRVKKKLTSQNRLLQMFHTSIDRGAYDNN